MAYAIARYPTGGQAPEIYATRLKETRSADFLAIAIKNKELGFYLYSLLGFKQGSLLNDKQMGAARTACVTFAKKQKVGTHNKHRMR